MKTANKASPVASLPPDPYVATLLGKITEGKHELSVGKGEKIFSQGDSADSLYFVQSGRVKISVVSAAGKEAVLSMLGAHAFFGEGALVGQTLRRNTATALEPLTVFQVEKRAMLRALHDHIDFSETFMATLLARNIDLEDDLCNQFFNDSEKRLARVLVKLTDQQSVQPSVAMPTLSHETLAEMVGTTRSRVTHFMNKFRKMGLIEYKGGLAVKREELSDEILDD
jgi:CRP/FNR family transcriptional regulator, cyclic AMP receptor protein